MKLAVVGSINTDMTVTAERIPLKNQECLGVFTSLNCTKKGPPDLFVVCLATEKDRPFWNGL